MITFPLGDGVFETLGEMLGSYNPLYLLAKCCMYLFFVIIIYYNFIEY